MDPLKCKQFMQNSKNEIFSSVLCEWFNFFDVLFFYHFIIHIFSKFKWIFLVLVKHEINYLFLVSMNNIFFSTLNLYEHTIPL